MSTEEKITENPEIVEPPKPMRRFKLDKKHIQGFIAGILLCAIAFTGLYYGTDGQFFSGAMSYSLPLVTDANFEDEVLKSDRIVLVVVYIKNNTWHPDWEKEYETTNKKNIKTAGLLASSKQFRNKLKAVKLDVDNSGKTMHAYDMQKAPFIMVFKKGKCVLVNNSDMIYQWVLNNCL